MALHTRQIRANLNILIHCVYILLALLLRDTDHLSFFEVIVNVGTSKDRNFWIRQEPKLEFIILFIFFGQEDKIRLEMIRSSN